MTPISGAIPFSVIVPLMKSLYSDWIIIYVTKKTMDVPACSKLDINKAKFED